MSESIPISYLRIWARKNQMTVTVERKSSDKYVIDHKDVYLTLPGAVLVPVKPRQVFQIVDHYPSLLLDDLHMIDGSAGRLYPLSANRPGEKGKPKLLTFNQVKEEVES